MKASCPTHPWLTRGLLCLLVAVCAALATLPVQAGKVLNDTLVTQPFSHHVWQDVLQQYADGQGNIDWTRLRAEPRRLNLYLDQLAAVSPENAPDYFPTPQDQLAYWINAQNAIALRLLLDAYPVDSLTQVPDFLRITRYHLGGQPFSLQQIRERILASPVASPDDLFALTDYSLDSPPVPSQPIGGMDLAGQLSALGMRAIQDPHMLSFDRDDGMCTGIALSPFLLSFSQGLLALPAWQQEDRDRIADPMQTTDTDLPRPKTWLDVVRPMAPPEVYAELGQPCNHMIRSTASTPELRRFPPL